MDRAAVRVTRPIMLVALAALALAGCGEKLSGAYVPKGDGTGKVFSYSKIEFVSGDTVDITALGIVREATYKIDGKRVAVTIDAQPLVLTIDDDGCLDGGSYLGTYCKE